MESYRTALERAYEAGIDALLAFQADASDSDVQAKILAAEFAELTAAEELLKTDPDYEAWLTATAVAQDDMIDRLLEAMTSHDFRLERELCGPVGNRPSSKPDPYEVRELEPTARAAGVCALLHDFSDRDDAIIAARDSDP
jgi:hypothetical protein